MEKTYSVPSIHCMHCTHTIKMELMEMDGISKVEADLDSKKVTITYTDTALEENALQLLTEIGYPVE